MNELEQIFKRTYTADDGEVVVVVGTRPDISVTEGYTECEFVFRGGKLLSAAIVRNNPGEREEDTPGGCGCVFDLEDGSTITACDQHPQGGGQL